MDKALHPASYWAKTNDNRIQCQICPHLCRLGDGQRGRCFVRKNQDDKIVLTTYGYSSGFCIDPIEKKPLYHFLPGTPVLSFGTAGCNLSCKFCQNWSISKSRQMDTLSSRAMPADLAKAAKNSECLSLAYTYNDPVIFFEYAVDTAMACRELGIKNVAVSAGYICEEPREEFFRYMDAANIDLKSFDKSFYKKVTGSELEVVLDTLIYLKKETSTWIEITNLLIPNENDSAKEIYEMTAWIYENLGADVPLHFSAFHPDYKMLDKQRTPLQTLLKAQQIAFNNGLNYVYIGNIPHNAAMSTYCRNCGERVIGRSQYEILEWFLDEKGKCMYCSHQCSGVFEGDRGYWGNKRQRVVIK